jgi:hypothetical protein
MTYRAFQRWLRNANSTDMLHTYRAISSYFNATNEIFPVAQQPLVGLRLLSIKASRSHSGTPHSVGLLWTSDQPHAQTSTWQHTTLTRDRHPCPPPPPSGIRTHSPSKRTVADPRHRPRSHWDRRERETSVCSLVSSAVNILLIPRKGNESRHISRKINIYADAVTQGASLTAIPRFIA